ncbi:GNAT family N-acetyltransferase [Paracraurococcus lichenis]|uniref:GNAT family N-acetyltransferase n=1 Tax=Paracraurococcus lichenis TaxID=3064888 RepID=A0ABT9E030_9PROT|nr:GNAT family N-acetyltransferase [Paracraurococcus sp. LOR1-02]MDO9709488.1 GNAT family N-acetyltransferase [Paracraurococcus sp. LOR1-02]
MTAIIRPFAAGEAAAFREIRLEALRRHPEAFGASIEEAEGSEVAAFAAGLAKPPPDAVFGAWLPGEAAPQDMAGFFVHRPRKVAHKGAVWGVYVRAEARGQGLGRMLMQRVIDQARGAGLETLLLTVTEAVPAARALYESLGFLAYGTEPRGLRLGPGHYVDETLMALDLRGA